MYLSPFARAKGESRERERDMASKRYLHAERMCRREMRVEGEMLKHGTQRGMYLHVDTNKSC